ANRCGSCVVKPGTAAEAEVDADLRIVGHREVAVVQHAAAVVAGDDRGSAAKCEISVVGDSGTDRSGSVTDEKRSNTDGRSRSDGHDRPRSTAEKKSVARCQVADKAQIGGDHEIAGAASAEVNGVSRPRPGEPLGEQTAVASADFSGVDLHEAFRRSSRAGRLRKECRGN